MPRLKRFLQRGRIEAGCDEAGRGCLAGPVFAAAVILPPKFRHPVLNDSKQLTEEEREMLRPYIEKHALAWAVGMMDAQEIDRVNILNASFGAMHRAIDQLVAGRRAARQAGGQPHPPIVRPSSEDAPDSVPRAVRSVMLRDRSLEDPRPSDER